MELWTESIGDPANPPVLLVAGANSSALGWPDEFVARLVDGGRRVLRYDHRDTGRSTTRPFSDAPYPVARLAEDALGVLDGWGLRSAHVVGLSLGSTLGQLLALDHPERLRGLTLMLGAALDVDFVGNLRRAHTGEPDPGGLPLPRRDVLDVLARRAEPPSDRAAALDRRVEEWRALAGPSVFDAAEFRRWEERAIEHAGTLEQPSAHGAAEPVPTERGRELRGVRVPTLVVQGELDPLNPPPHGRHLADLIPGAVLWEVAGLGHALPGALHGVLADRILAHTAE
ncbi:alpha/beta hydrolase [Actinoalloteichus sp. AHMU CJ021]|nr:alpha/beta hydrolase [Actinoalloteichus sp. AHMU CJ021]